MVASSFQSAIAFRILATEGAVSPCFHCPDLRLAIAGSGFRSFAIGQWILTASLNSTRAADRAAREQPAFLAIAVRLSSEPIGVHRIKVSRQRRTAPADNRERLALQHPFKAQTKHRHVRKETVSGIVPGLAHASRWRRQWRRGRTVRLRQTGGLRSLVRERGRLECRGVGWSLIEAKSKARAGD